MVDEIPFEKVGSDDLKLKFALERSHKSMEFSSEIGKASGQAVILINGGAATAILTFITKESTHSFMSYASWAILSYAIGVIFGALTLHSLVESNGQWNLYFQSLIWHPETEDKIAHDKGHKWGKRARICFWVAIVAFLIGSIIIARGFSRLEI